MIQCRRNEEIPESEVTISNQHKAHVTRATLEVDKIEG